MSKLWAVNLLAILIIITLVFHGGLNVFKYDNSDSKVLKKRSNLIVYTDYGTGNQYIKSFTDTSLSLRLDKDGEQVNIYFNKIENTAEKGLING